MTFTVSSSVLLKHLQSISGAVSSNATLPILEHFLFDLVGSQLTISATDLDISMSATAVVVSTDEGKIALPARLLLDVLKTLATQPVTFHIDVEKKSVNIVSSNGKYKMTGEDADEFPVSPDAEDITYIALSSQLITSAINKTLFATSTDDLRPAMTGVLLELTESGVTFVATDGYKFVKYKRNDKNSPQNLSFILPKKALNVLKTVLGNSSEEVKIAYNTTHAFFHCEEVLLICRLVDAKYPAYNSIIPLGNENNLLIDRQDLLNSLRRMSIYANKTTYRVVFSLGSPSKLNISAQDFDLANAANEVLNCTYEGDDLEIAFNAKSLMDILGALKQQQVAIKLGAANKAGLIVPADPVKDEEILMLLIPQL